MDWSVGSLEFECLSKGSRALALGWLGQCCSSRTKDQLIQYLVICPRTFVEYTNVRMKARAP